MYTGNILGAECAHSAPEMLHVYTGAAHFCCTLSASSNSKLHHSCPTVPLCVDLVSIGVEKLLINCTMINSM